MSNPPVRPRKQARRSHSMYENPGEVVLQQKVSPPLDSIMDIEHQVPHLPHFTKDAEGVPRITGETMIDVLDGKYSHVHDKVIVIDCRFEYEYEGGHINGAINFNDKDKLAEHLFDSTSPLSTSRSLVIFHCEYSVHRAPIMAQFFRSHDRKVNPDRYPALTYPESYVLDGGYKSFFQSYSSLCFPQEYIEMNAAQHASDCEKGMGRVKKQRMKLGRAQTFAGFGQGSSPMNSSPIGPRGSLHRYASDSGWSPAVTGRAQARNPSDSTVEATNTSSDTSMALSDSDVDMDTTTDLPTFNQPSFGRPFEAGRAATRRMFSSFN
jgi:M-phase inducer tyrosine phosphatase